MSRLPLLGPHPATVLTVLAVLAVAGCGAGPDPDAGPGSTDAGPGTSTRTTPPTPTAPPPSVTRHPALPDAEPYRTGALEDAPAGSVLVEYGPAPDDVPTAGGDAATGDAPTVVYLVTGDALLEVPVAPALRPTADPAGPVLVDLLDATTDVVVRTGDVGDVRHAVRDLLDGSTVLAVPPDTDGGDQTLVALHDGTTDLLLTTLRYGAPDAPVLQQLDRLRRDGDVAASTAPAAVVAPGVRALGPDRRALLADVGDGLAVLDARDLSPLRRVAQPYPGRADACGLIGWVSAGVVLRCHAGGAAPVEGTATELWLAPDDGAPALRTTPDDTADDGALPLGAWSVWSPGGRSVLVTAERGDGTLRLWEVPAPMTTSQPLRALPAVPAGSQVVGVRGDRLLVVRGADDSAPAGTDLVALDPWTGAATVLLDAPPVAGMRMRVVAVVGGP